MYTKNAAVTLSAFHATAIWRCNTLTQNLIILRNSNPMIERELSRLCQSKAVVAVVNTVVSNYAGFPFSHLEDDLGTQLLAQLRERSELSQRELFDLITRAECFSYRAFIQIDAIGRFRYFNPLEHSYTEFSADRKPIVLQTEEPYPPRDIIFHYLETLLLEFS